MVLINQVFQKKQRDALVSKSVRVPHSLGFSSSSHLPFFSATFGVFFTLSFLLSPLAYAAPVQDEIITGRVTIDTVGDMTTVTQQQSKGIINWKSFNVGANETVKFDQLAGNHSITLNRVTGGEGASQILGRIEANGSVWILNADGIHFGEGSVVNVAGILASTYNISNDNFLSGNYQFESFGVSHNGKIYNAGEIRVGGLAAMLSHDVENVGVIHADVATVMLGSNPTWVLDAYGDDTINFAVSDELLQKKATLKHSGKIYADGGHVYLSVDQAEGVIDNVINVTGQIQADNVSVEDGVIVLSAGSGDVYLSGDLQADSGKVHVLGKRIALLDNATIDVSGDNPGEVLIGGDYLGSGDLPHADIVLMSSDASIFANANDYGNGGKVILWSDLATLFYGNIEAKGGLLGGDGGFVETSSKNNLTAFGSVDARSYFGKAGLWLLDPRNVTIDASTTNQGSFSGGDPNVWTPSASESIIGVQTIDEALELNDVTITTSGSGADEGNITIKGTYNFSDVYSSNTLTLKADKDIIFLTTSSWEFDPGTNANLVLFAGANHAGTGSLSFSDTNTYITFGSTGSVDVYYNPKDYETASDFQSDNKIFIDGLGTYTEYMLINTADDLQSIGAADLGYTTRMANNYALAQDIDANLAVSVIEPIGNSVDPFLGSFDGQGFKISNLTIDMSGTDRVGLFGLVEGTGTIENVGLVDASITGASYVGALVGRLGADVTVSEAYSTGSVTGGFYVGGLVGYSDGSDVMTSYSSSTVTGTGNSVGGLIGYLNSVSTVSESYSTGTVSGVDNVGGLIGYAYEATVMTSYSRASVSGEDNVGGLIGSSSTTAVTDTYARGDVTGSNFVGGHIGLIASPSEGSATIVTRAYSVGSVTGGTVGALFGSSSDNGFQYVDSFSDTQSSGQLVLLGGGSSLSNSGSFLIDTTALMKNESTYTNWDFESTWQINEGMSFPQLFYETLDPDDENTSSGC